MNIDWSYVIVGLVTAIPVAYGIYLLDRRSKRESASAEKMGVSTEEREGATQLRAEVRDLMETYREDIKDLRLELAAQDTRTLSLEKDRDECRQELSKVNRELDTLKRRHPENGVP